MHILMLADREIYPDGVTLVRARKGETLEVPEQFGERLVTKGVAEIVDVAQGEERVAIEVPADGTISPPAGDPLDGLNAKQAAAAIAGMDLEQLDAIPADENRKGVLDAIAARRAELGDDTGGDGPASA